MILRLTLPALLLESGLLWLLALRPLQDRAVSAIAILLGTSAVYLISAWLILKETQSTRRRAGWVLGWAILFRLTAWPLEPAFTDDVYRYRWESRLQEAGGNPYEAAPSDPGWARLRDVTYPRISGRDFRAVYGPLTEMVYHWTYRAIARFTEDPFRQCFWLKLPAAFL
ncbi:MAG: hypothetical protein HY235_25405, partial [Acidobacteria bacterium]|nr:hypothetical protein [Acidobacteriota bacterium]